VPNPSRTHNSSGDGPTSARMRVRRPAFALIILTAALAFSVSVSAPFAAVLGAITVLAFAAITAITAHRVHGTAGKKKPDRVAPGQLVLAVQR
jgi:heme/copper-type cytochrome/quinol oxidase subunit 4